MNPNRIPRKHVLSILLKKKYFQQKYSGQGVRLLWKGQRAAIGPFATVFNLSAAAIHQPRHAAVTAPTLIHLRLTFFRPLCIQLYQYFLLILTGKSNLLSPSFTFSKKNHSRHSTPPLFSALFSFLLQIHVESLNKAQFCNVKL